MNMMLILRDNILNNHKHIHYPGKSISAMMVFKTYRMMQIVSDMRSRESMLRNIGFSSRSFCPSMRSVNKLPFYKNK